MIRVGMGYDVHQLVENRDLWLGGIKIEHEKGLLGHSDADVLIHAIYDALLGAANMRDIGFHFPDTGKEYENIDSKKFLYELSHKGLKRRLNDNVSEEYIDRLNMELKVIDEMGFNDYFLIVYDYVLYAKK